MPAFFDIETPADLLSKLEREFDRLRGDPCNADHAFNFFVTAEHMLDWKYPGNGAKRKEVRNSEPLLKVTWDLATGAKHFKLYNIHKSVSGTKRSGGFWANGYFAKGFWAKGMFAEPKLVVELNADDALGLGEMLSAHDLAE